MNLRQYKYAQHFNKLKKRIFVVWNLPDLFEF